MIVSAGMTGAAGSAIWKWESLFEEVRVVSFFDFFFNLWWHHHWYPRWVDWDFSFFRAISKIFKPSWKFFTFERSVKSNGELESGGWKGDNYAKRGLYMRSSPSQTVDHQPTARLGQSLGSLTWESHLKNVFSWLWNAFFNLIFRCLRSTWI